MTMTKKLASKAVAIVGFMLILGLSSCNDGKSYSDLLTEEEHAVNWYLAQNRVVPYVPEDSVFETGNDAPFYRMNSEGTVYMRVVNPGDMDNRPKKGDQVYFRFIRKNIKSLYEGVNLSGEGNANDMNSPLNGTNFIYGNNTYQSTTRYGTGIQLPLDYLGYNCEVDLIVKSIEGFSGEISQCNPYIYEGLKYFKAEY